MSKSYKRRIDLGGNGGTGGRSRWRELRFRVCATALCALLWQGIHAADAARFYASQPLAAALEKFAGDTGLQLVYRAEVAEGITSRDAVVQPAPADTLRELLRGTGLGFSFIEARTVTIFRIQGTDGRVESTELPAASVVDDSAFGNSDEKNTGVNPMSRQSFFAKIASFFFACGSAGGAWHACAQESDNSPATAAADAADLSEVTVTGSRVITNGNNSPTPLTVVAVEDLAATHPTTVFEALNDLPVFAGSRSSLSIPSNAGGNNSAINTLNLRGLGALRTLVLYDGHRFPSTNQDGLIDTNMIPQMLLQRVDVVTGGVSAVYGSDAISGVVNFVTDRKFEGFKANAQQGVAEPGDDKSYELGVAYGTSLFGGRGHVMGSYQIHDDDGILHRTDRKLGEGQLTMQGTGTAAQPYFLVYGARVAGATFGGKIVPPATCNAVCASNPLLNMQFATNGVLTPFVNGSTAGLANGLQVGGDGAYTTGASLKAAQGMHQAYARFDFELTDDIHYFLTGSRSSSTTFINRNNNMLNNVVLSSSNAFLSAANQLAMTSRGIATFNYGKYWAEDVIAPINTNWYAQQYYINTGFEGRLGDNYRWELSYSNSVSKQDSLENDNIDNGRLSAALDAVVNPANGQVVCNVTLTNPGLYPGCVPINVFGPTSESQEAIDYIVSSAKFSGKTTLHDVSGSIAGAPFSTWAGEVNVALSGEWRRLGYEMVSSAQSSTVDPLLCTGLRFNCTANTTSKYVSVQDSRTPVTMDITEGALEADVPLLKDIRFAQAVNLNAAVRYAHYSSTGTPLVTLPESTHTFNATTWKAGLNWHINDALTVRATRSRDFRAPNLNDLYQPGSVRTITFTDLLTIPSTSPVVPQQTGGNPALQPEVGNTSTLGFVWQASDKLSFAVDGFDIKIDNAILAVTGGQNNIQTACYASGGTSYYCTLQERPLGFTNTSPANAVTKWYLYSVNIAQQHTYGIDFESNYKTLLAERPFSLRGLVTYTPHIIYSQPGVNTFDQGGVDFNNNGIAATPVWRATLMARYSPIERLTIDWQTRWRSELHHDADPTQVFAPPNKVAAASYSNINLAYRFSSPSRGQADLYLNVQNVFDKQPPGSAFSGLQTGPGRFGGFVIGDDPIGRYYALGVRYKF
jgi:iron complex outermembrane receptor protein